MGSARYDVLIIGSSLAGMAVAERLCQAKADLSTCVVTDETGSPYDRPPLSKQYLAGTLTAADRAMQLQPDEWFADNHVDLRRGASATALDALLGAIELDSGETLEATNIVVSTGARARIPEDWRSAGVHTLRSLADAEEIKRRLMLHAGELVVIGAGFIGLEVASTALRLGWHVTIVEQASTALSRVVPVDLSAKCLTPVLAQGVALHTDTRVDRIDVLDPQTGRAAVVAGGSTLEADMVVAGVGSAPNVEWMSGSGILISDGVVCDAAGRTNVPGVWAAGDVANWPNPFVRARRRFEQWQAAKEQGEVVARAILGETGAAWESPPYFWSDYFGTKLQLVGECAPDMRGHIRTTGDDRWVALFGDELLRGLVGLSNPKAVALGRRLIATRTTFEDAKCWLNELRVA